LNVDVGKELLLGPIVPFTNSDPEGAFTGSFYFQLTGCPPLNYFGISNKYGRNFNSASVGENYLTLSSTTVANMKKYLFHAMDTEGNLKYKFIDNVAASNTYTVAYDQLVDFDQTVEFTFPQTNQIYFASNGRETGQPEWQPGFVVGDFFANSSSPLYTSIKTGSINSLSYYNLFLHLIYSDYSLMLLSRGPVPQGVTWPNKADYGSINESASNFVCKAPSSFVYRVSTWNYASSNPTTSASWTVISSAKTQTFSAWPAEILSLYPTLKTNQFVYGTSSYYSGTVSYEDVLTERMAAGSNAPGTSIAIQMK
jgi:hypothetical protein